MRISQARTWSLGAAALLLACAAFGSAKSADLRYFAYQADNAEARHRSADIIVTVKPGMLSSRVIKLWRKRGKDLNLVRPESGFAERDLADALALPREDAVDLKLYGIDPREGEGFVQGACDGAADRAYLAFAPVKPSQPLTIWVLRVDAASHKPALCETLVYSWRGEWQMAPRNRRFADELGPATSTR